MDKKLVLHFDIRNTILVADSKTNVTVEQSLNSYLTGVAWGYPDFANHKWLWAQDTPTPSLERPFENAVTYYKYAERTLIKTPINRLEFRKVTGDFTQTEIGAPFYRVFERHLKELEYPYEFNPHLCLKGDNGKNYHYVLPSFFELLKSLSESERHFSIILRTFGLDARCSGVLNATKLFTEGHHPEFPDGLPISVNTDIAKIVRSEDKIELHFGEKIENHEGKISDQLANMGGHVSAVRDDFDWWMKHGFSHAAGKPFWIDEESKNLHIFFDDNIRIQEPDCIVDVRQFGQGKYESLNREEMRKFKDKYLVQVDFLKAITDRQYFVKALKNCENIIFL